MVKLKVTDDVTERGGGQILDRLQRLLDTVGIQLRIGDLEEHDGIDLHGDVILGDNRLRIEVRDLLLERNLLGNALKHRDQDVKAGVPRRAVGAEALHNVGLGLRNDLDVGHEDHDHHKYEDTQCN